MNDKHKAAYRKLLYNFLIQIKQPETLTDAMAIGIGRYAGPVAYVLHNFALASANDFVGFDEVEFWRLLAAWDGRYPELGVSGFRKMFEWDLANG